MSRTRSESCENPRGTVIFKLAIEATATESVIPLAASTVRNIRDCLRRIAMTVRRVISIRAQLAKRLPAGPKWDSAPSVARCCCPPQPFGATRPALSVEHIKFMVAPTFVRDVSPAQRPSFLSGCRPGVVWGYLVWFGVKKKSRIRRRVRLSESLP